MQMGVPLLCKRCQRHLRKLFYLQKNGAGQTALLHPYLKSELISVETESASSRSGALRGSQTPRADSRRKAPYGNDNNTVIALISILCSGYHELKIGQAQWYLPLLFVVLTHQLLYFAQVAAPSSISCDPSLNSMSA